MPRVLNIAYYGRINRIRRIFFDFAGFEMLYHSSGTTSRREIDGYSIVSATPVCLYFC
jgi:hypothetical protein